MVFGTVKGYRFCNTKKYFLFLRTFIKSSESEYTKVLFYTLFDSTYARLLSTYCTTLKNY